MTAKGNQLFILFFCFEGSPNSCLADNKCIKSFFYSTQLLKHLNEENINQLHLHYFESIERDII